MTTFDKLKGAAATLADAAVKTTGDLAQKGKKQMDLLALENKLSRAQQKRQIPNLCRQLSNAGDAFVMSCSSLKGDGVEDLRHVLADAVKQARDAGNPVFQGEKADEGDDE